MAKITSKLQVTIPKVLAQQFGIHPGDEIEWIAAGNTIRIVPHGQISEKYSSEERLKIFDAATQRQRDREASQSWPAATASRGWTRDELYDRACPR